MSRPLFDRGPKPLSGFEGRDVRTLIDAQAALRSSYPFLVWQPFDAPERTWSYAGFRDAIRRFAGGFMRAASGRASGC